MPSRFRLRRGSATGKVLLARQGDGLGERLNALLNAMRLARLLDVDFRFAWPMWLAWDPNHAIVAADEVFTAEFLEAHLLDDEETRAGFDLLPGPDADLRAVRTSLRRAERGLRVPARPLHTRLDPVAVPGLTDGFAAEFAAVGFAPAITDAIEAARSVPIGERSVGLHLRAGDLMYGAYRSRTAYWDKAVPAPLARELMRRHRAEGHEVLVLGQNRALVSGLCRDAGATDVATLPARAGLTRTGEAVFDLVLLSRCDRIVGGHSGFAIQAASIGGRSVDFWPHVLPPDELVAVTRADLAEHGSDYDAITSEFAWWATWRAVRDHADDATTVELLTAASAADPANPRSRLHLAAHHHRRGRLRQANEVLVEALRADVTMSDEPRLASVLLFSLLGLRDYDCLEIHDDVLAAAAEEPGPATLYRASRRAQDGDGAGATEDAQVFLDFAASDPRLSALERLEPMVLATIRRRIKRAGQQRFEVTVLDDVTGRPA